MAPHLECHVSIDRVKIDIGPKLSYILFPFSSEAHLKPTTIQAFKHTTKLIHNE